MSRSRPKRLPAALLAAAALLFALAIAYRGPLAGLLAARAGHAHPGAEVAGDVAYYTCSMDPSVKAHGPGRCPICGMDLTPVSRAELASDTLRFDAETMQRIGARFAVAAKRTLIRRVVALGSVVARPSPPVAAVPPADPPRPDTAAPAADPTRLAAAAPSAESRRPAAAPPSAEPRRPAAASGWVEALVHGDDVGAVKAGQAAWVTLPSLPLARFEGVVDLVEPDPGARNARLRVAVLDPGRALQPGVAAQVHVDLELVDRLAVPAKAVLYSGDRRITFVDRGEGRLEPRGLKVGTQADGFIEVLEGLGAGDRVLIAGTFLAAAESRVRSAALWHDEPVSKATLASERAKAQKERAERERAERERAKAERAADAGAKDERAAGAGAKAGGGGPKGHEGHEGDEGDEGDKGDKGDKGEGAKGGEP